MGIKNKAKPPQKTTTMVIFYSEPAKRARKFFGKVLESKRLRGIKYRAKNTIIIFYSERAKKIFG